jgi:hypothetical protein
MCSLYMEYALVKSATADLQPLTERMLHKNVFSLYREAHYAPTSVSCVANVLLTCSLHIEKHIMYREQFLTYIYMYIYGHIHTCIYIYMECALG